MKNYGVASSATLSDDFILFILWNFLCFEYNQAIKTQLQFQVLYWIHSQSYSSAYGWNVSPSIGMSNCTSIEKKTDRTITT